MHMTICGFLWMRMGTMVYNNNKTRWGGHGGTHASMIWAPGWPGNFPASCPDSFCKKIRKTSNKRTEHEARTANSMHTVKQKANVKQQPPKTHTTGIDRHLQKCGQTQ